MSLFKNLAKIISGKKEKLKPALSPRQRPPQPQPIQPLQARRTKGQLFQAQTEAREIVLAAKDEALRIRSTAETEVRIKLENLERKLGVFEERERQALVHEQEIQKKLGEADKIKQKNLEKLEQVAGLTKDEAKDLILKAVESNIAQDIARRIKEAESKAREEANRKAREILVDAMRFGATNYVAEYTVSAVKLPDEDMKGRIIGKEGRNIRTFEQATGVDVDLDEEGVIRLSSFDSIRREIARVALERLIVDGRIQPSRIEEIVDQTRRDIE
ncbi:DUF3552 domain-containing protein, partial [Candidatus Gottesmanbacteria bacterium]|nr:DUF3552 domain-containing protein [Candidatus Gottesmanbacteria bacterium]